MTKQKGKYVTISLPKGIADEIDRLIDELHYWPSRGSFAREACLEKIREEQRRLKELMEAQELARSRLGLIEREEKGLK
jgi:Arc/MetJ-type ribon-helix-helix transcriptional regulator